jgi:predicted PurR-regulated permease PerM
LLGIDPKAARYTWTAAAVLLLLIVIYLIREALIVFVTALLFAYLLYPLMDLIDRHLPSKTRTPALAMTFILVIGVLAAFGVSVGSLVANQAVTLTAEAPKFLDQMRHNPQPQRPGEGCSPDWPAGSFGLAERDLPRNYSYSEFPDFARWTEHPRQLYRDAGFGEGNGAGTAGRRA